MSGTNARSEPGKGLCLTADIVSGIGFAICAITAICLLWLEYRIQAQDDPSGDAILFILNCGPYVLQFFTLLFGGLVGCTVCLVAIPIALSVAISRRQSSRITAVVLSFAGPMLVVICAMIVYSFP